MKCRLNIKRTLLLLVLTLSFQTILFNGAENGQYQLNFGKELSNINLEVFNSIGQIVLKEVHKQKDELHFFIEEAPGVYLVHISSNERRKEIFKILHH